MGVYRKQHNKQGEKNTAKLPEPLEELMCLPQWVGWRYVQERGSEKLKKPPIDPQTGKKADKTDPDTWGTYEQAVAAVRQYDLEGVGFAVSEDDPYCFVDLDNCIEDGEIKPWALKIVERLDSYTEISPSGTGLRVWIRGTKPGSRCKRKYHDGKVEIYDARQFSTVTGRVLRDRPIRSAHAELEALYWELWAERTGEPQRAAVTRRAASGEFCDDDESLLQKARNAKRTGAVFARLYDHGDRSVLDDSSDKSHSGADIALCGMLAYWTGKDRARMDRLFRGSALMSGKWDEIHHGDGRTYGQGTMDEAIKNCTNVYDPNYRHNSKPSKQERIIECVNFSITYSWTGRGGGTDHDLYMALLRRAWRYGRLLGDGLEVSAASRDLLVDAAIGSRETLNRSARRLEDLHRGLVKTDNGGPKRGATYLLRFAPDLAKVDHTDTQPPHCVNPYGRLCQKLEKFRYRRGVLDKRCGAILRYVLLSRRVVDLEDVLRHLDRTPTNQAKYDLKRRQVRRLVDLGMLLEAEGGYVTPPLVVLEERVNAYLEESGCNLRERLQRQNNLVDRQNNLVGRFEHRFERDPSPENERRLVEAKRRLVEAIDELKQLRRERSYGVAGREIEAKPPASQEIEVPLIESEAECFTPTVVRLPQRPKTDARQASEREHQAHVVPIFRKPEVFTPAVEVQEKTTQAMPTGAEIVARWEEANGDPLTCKCVFCASPTPRYLTLKQESSKEQPEDKVASERAVA
jgi:putative DNA primase/helicase